MATHCFAGNCARGMSLVALHNGGGVGVEKRLTAASAWCWTAVSAWTKSLKTAMPWDVMSGVSRRAWARNENAVATAAEYNLSHRGTDHITLPYCCEEGLIESVLKEQAQ